MRSSISVKLKKVARLFLAFSVSFWMAGAGCLWGCSNTAMASEMPELNQPAVASHSCHARTHDCCAKKLSKKTASLTAPSTVLSLLGMQSDGMMKDCPLVVNSNAAITKATTDLSDSAELPIADPPKIESPIKLVDLSSTPIQFLNRGPTYLRFCVFLI